MHTHRKMKSRKDAEREAIVPFVGRFVEEFLLLVKHEREKNGENFFPFGPLNKYCGEIAAFPGLHVIRSPVQNEWGWTLSAGT